MCLEVITNKPLPDLFQCKDALSALKKKKKKKKNRKFNGFLRTWQYARYAKRHMVVSRQTERFKEPEYAQLVSQMSTSL